MMFFWSSNHTHVVLSDAEEIALVRELNPGDPSASIGYMTSGERRRKYEKQIFQFFESFLASKPQEFNQKYVFRSCYDDEAQQIFPVFLNAYGRITKRASNWHRKSRGWREDLVDRLMYDSSGNVSRVTLFGRGRWPWSEAEELGQISFPTDTIRRLAGSAGDFYVATSEFHLKFHRDFVRMAIADENREIFKPE